MNAGITKAVMYARVSSREQEETGYSLDAQEKLLTEYAVKKGLEVARVFRVTESASGRQVRVVFEELLRYAAKHAVPIILCEKIDRLTRNLKDAATVSDWILTGTGREVHFVKENSIINRDTRAHENLVWDMKVAIARFYTNNLSEEVRKGQKEKLAQGWLPTKPPLGYKTVGEKGKKTHVIDEEKAPLVRRMFELYATGEYPVQHLSKVMYDEGLRTRGEYRLVRSRLASILSDPFYIGKNRWKGIVTDGAHVPLLERDTFERVQAVLVGKTQAKTRKHAYLFKGLVKCRDCGGLLTWERQKGHVYGHCNQYRKCTKRVWYKETEFTKLIGAELSRLHVNSPRLAEWVKKALKELHSTEVEYHENVLRDLNARRTRLSQQQDMMYTDRLEGRISAEEYDVKKKGVDATISDVVASLQRHTDTEKRYYELGSNIFELSQRAPRIFEKAKPETQRRLLRLMCQEMYVESGKLAVQFTETFQSLARIVNELNGSKMPQNLLSPVKIFELEEGGSPQGKNRHSRSKKSSSSGGGIRTHNLLLTRILMFPKGVDYIITVSRCEALRP